MPSTIERPPDAAGVYPIWPGTGVPPGSEEWTRHEQTMHIQLFKAAGPLVRNVVIPTVTMFTPAPGTANGTALIAAPGGGYRFLMIDHEGYDMARWLTGLGVTAFVLKYRVAPTPEDDAEMPAFLHELFTTTLRPPDAADVAPPAGNEAVQAIRALAEEDGRQAVRFVRQHAADWGLAPHRIGIAGFSAGGGVALGAAMQHDAESRPDFVAGIYPAYPAAIPVPADAPPLFIAIADNDNLVAPISAARLYEAWHQAGRPVELHIFGSGGHGFGMLRQELLSDAWVGLFKQWLVALGYLVPAGEAAATTN